MTGISFLALRSSILSQFTADQKVSWAKNRKTICEEDWAYSLLSICAISMPVIYGEGKENAIRQLKKEIDGIFKTKKIDLGKILYAKGAIFDSSDSVYTLCHPTIRTDLLT